MMTSMIEQLIKETRIKWWCNTLAVLTTVEDILTNDRLLMRHLTKNKFHLLVQLPWSNLSNHTSCPIFMVNSQEYHHLLADSRITQAQRVAIRTCPARLHCCHLQPTIPNFIETNQTCKPQSTTISNRVGIPRRWSSRTITKLILTLKLMRHRPLALSLVTTTSKANSRLCIPPRDRCWQLGNSQK